MSDFPPPLITCLCLTRNRRQWLPQAIRCFQQQTYPRKELLILADGASIRDIVPDDPPIRLMEIEDGRTIGEKRNFGCAQAHGEVIAHWDDDDWSAPERLAEQWARMRETDKAVVGYHRMIFAAADQAWLYAGTPNLPMGTSLFFRKSWWQEHPFPAKQIGEDGEFVRNAHRHLQLSSVEAGELMVATVHPGNTSPRNVKGNPWEPWNHPVPSGFEYAG